MTSEPKAPGAPAIYLYRQVDRDDKGTASTEYNYLRIKKLTEEGRKYANVEIPFDKEGYKVSRIHARTIRPDGTIVNYEGKIYENTIVKSKTVKYLAKTFSMPEVSVGSIGNNTPANARVKLWSRMDMKALRLNLLGGSGTQVTRSTNKQLVLAFGRAVPRAFTVANL